MARTIILSEEQFQKMTRVDEVVGGFMDKVRAASSDAKRGYKDDKTRNRRIRELRDFMTDLYVMSGKKNGTITSDMYKAVRKAVAKRIWQIQDVIKNHGLDYDEKAKGSGKRDFFKTQDALKSWKDYFTKKGQYNDAYLGRDLYDAFERCLNMPYHQESDFFYTFDKKINPLMSALSRRTGDFQYTN